MDNFRLAVKAFIIKDGKILLLQRIADSPTRPGTWDFPGGRLEIGENPFEGVQREIKEETSLDIEIVSPLDIHHFTRDDGQSITMIIFLCKPLSDKIVLDEENQAYDWSELDSEKIPEWLRPVVTKFNKFELARFV